MKRLTLLLLVLAASFTLLTACGNDIPDPQTPETPAITDASETPEAPETEAELPADGLAVVANGEAKFILIRPEQATKAEISLMTSIRKYIEEKTGVTLEVKDDWIKKGQEHDASAFEILIGDTNYNETKAVKDSFQKDQMAVSVQGNKIVFYSSQDLGHLTLAEQLDSLFSGFLFGKSFVIPKDYSFTADYILRLANAPAYTGASSSIRMFDGGNDNNVLLVIGAKKNDFQSYLGVMEQAGFTLYTKHEAADNLFATFTKKDIVVNLSYMNLSRTVRIIEEPLKGLPLRAEDVTPTEEICQPAIRLFGHEFYLAANSTNRLQNGLGIIYRLPDGRLIVVDGGLHAQYYGQDENYLLKNLREMSPDPNNIVVAAWIFTHAHDDHVLAFYELAKESRFSDGTIRLETLIYNFEALDSYPMMKNSDGSQYHDVALVPEFNKIRYSAPTQVITAHTGQIFHFGDTTIEFLFTPEDFYPRPFDHHDTTSLAFRITLAGQTIMNLGDMTGSGADILQKNFGKYLKSDILQVGDHGGGGSPELYQSIDAKTLLWPSGNCEFYRLHTHYRVEPAVTLATDIYVAGYDQQTILLPYTPIQNKQEAIREATEKRSEIERENIKRKS